MDPNTIFDGIGTEIIGIIISLIIGAVGGGIAGYKIGVKRSSKQKQVAGANSKQRQELRVDGTAEGNDSVKLSEKVSQCQKAGDGSIQTQIASISSQQTQRDQSDGDGGK